MNKMYLLLILLCAVIPVEVVWINHLTDVKKTNLLDEYDSKAFRWEQKRKIYHQKEKNILAGEHEKNKYLATGKTVYDRIYNRQNQTITGVIKSLAEEVFPDRWKCTVGVEEFNSFILFVHSMGRKDDVTVSMITEYLTPLVTYAHLYLKNVAVFDRNHKCFLFFDKTALQIVAASGVLNSETISKIKQTGKEFTRYNSVEISCKHIEGHLYVQATVSGQDGIYECLMMLDTGASMTIISADLAQKTGHENLHMIRKELFSTVKGTLACPIVRRTLVAGSIEITEPVAVNEEDDTNLLGMDFFKGKNYTIDSLSSCIYIWSE